MWETENNSGRNSCNPFQSNIPESAQMNEGKTQDLS
jgi:hypothetical protein